ncbi:tripartite tricarboxylate transporter TctB family protein [Amaricoccus solimangrovi]|uniref:Tripartite tricarboxylate transporter TctB family protein n=1 Tax=Amaricoccus solimangrovi TaxID=2589815 RepID=A0A501WUA7_9RHOB|nr:tripartite tricarboxylate transporter TctB family protein [Amaricoccus solimangrovi]TPE50957.1 tripartite tricarboxylate transporter TctB family protein [Amaricoccus solimangrovi]
MDYHEHHVKHRGEDAFGLVVLVVSVLLLWKSYTIAGFSALSSPGAFPMAASAVMVFSASLVVIGNARRRGRLSGEEILPRTVVLFTALVIAYAAALVPLGFLPASFLFLILAMKLLYRASWLRSLIIALASLALVYIVFRLVFQVVLPQGIVPEDEILAMFRHHPAPEAP